jgi:hypothetical protein
VIAELPNTLAETDAGINAALAAAARDSLPDSAEINAEKITLEQERSVLEARGANLEEAGQVPRFAENFEVYGAHKIWRQMIREDFALHAASSNG